MPHSLAVQIVSIMALWVMFLSALRFSANSVIAMRPLGVAAFRTVRWRMDRRESKREFQTALDAIYMRFTIATCTPWSVSLLLMGLFLIGGAFSCGTTGDVMMLVSHHPERWSDSDRYLDWAAAILSCAGMATTLAAISKNRPASLLISSGFAITGLGIGVIAAVYL